MRIAVVRRIATRANHACHPGWVSSARHCHPPLSDFSKRFIAHATSPCLKSRNQTDAAESKRRRRQNSKGASTKASKNPTTPLPSDPPPKALVITKCPYVHESRMISTEEYEKQTGAVLQEVQSQIDKLCQVDKDWLKLNKARIDDGLLSFHEMHARIQTPLLDQVTDFKDKNMVKETLGWYKKTTVREFLEKFTHLMEAVSPGTRTVLENHIWRIPMDDENSKMDRHTNVEMDAAGTQFKQYVINNMTELMSRWIRDGPTRTRGRSMMPTIRESAIIFCESLHPRRDVDILKDLKRGDVVMFITYRKNNLPNFLVKRITGLPGDRVQDANLRSVIVPPNCFWAVGDNQEESKDSRHFGAVPAQNLKAKVLYTTSNFLFPREIGPAPLVHDSTPKDDKTFATTLLQQMKDFFKF